MSNKNCPKFNLLIVKTFNKQLILLEIGKAREFIRSSRFENDN